MSGHPFKIDSEYEPAGDQPGAIDALVEGLNTGLACQVLLGATGTGKTYVACAFGQHACRNGRPTLYRRLSLLLQDFMKARADGTYAKAIKPYHERVIQSAKGLTGAKSVFHCCGSAYQFIDHMIDIGVDGLNPVQVTAKNMEPERLKEEFGDRMAFWGGINTQTVLPYGTPAEVKAETGRVVDILGKGGGYVLNSVHNIQFEVPPENIVAMFEEGRDHAY